MKNQIIAFILLITYSLCTVTITKVNAGTCANSVYTFTLTGTTDAALGATQTAAVTLSSPASTTPTCTIVSENPAVTRRLGAGDVTITCTISSALSGATITVSEVKVNNAAATITNIQQMSGTATCAGSSSGSGSGSGSGSTDEKKDSGNFIQLSRFLLMIILFAF